MIPRNCAFPNCIEPTPEGPFAVFCLEHYYLLPAKDTGFLYRWQIKCSRCTDHDLKKHMSEQLHGYILQAVRKLECLQAAH